MFPHSFVTARLRFGFTPVGDVDFVVTVHSRQRMREKERTTHVDDVAVGNGNLGAVVV